MSEYDTDILKWTVDQAALLRRLAKGERVNSHEFDWPNIAEEIEDVGSEQRSAVETLLTNIMQHQLHILAWPQTSAVRHWQHESKGWRVQIARRLRRAPSLRAVLEGELGELYGDALLSTYDEFDGKLRPQMPAECPWTLDELLGRP